MTQTDTWTPVEGSLTNILRRYPHPLIALKTDEIPAIFRIYHVNEGHGPHFDSVSKRSKLFNYAVSRFRHQFAGVLCIQDSHGAGDGGEPFIYRCPSTPDVQKDLGEIPFQQYVAERRIARVQV